MKIFEVAGEGKLHGLTVMSLDAFVGKEDDVEESDMSGIMHAAKNYNKSFLITAELAEGGKKTFRVKAQSERVAREKFEQHHNQATILKVKEEVVDEASKELPQWKKDWYAKQKPNSWPKHPQPYHNPNWLDELSPEEREKLLKGKGALKEFAPGAGGDEGEEDTLLKFARMWYNGDLPTQQRVEQALQRQGWEIGELESEEGGAFVVRAGDENGDSYIGFAPADLTESQLRENASKLLSVDDRNGVITVVVQAPDGTKRSLANDNPRYINQWLNLKYGLTLPPSIMRKFVESAETPEKELERLKLRQNAWKKAPLKDQAATQARIRELEKEIKDKKDLSEAPGDFGLGANYRPIPDDEMQALMGRSKNKTKTKRDKYDYPYIHGSNIEVKDESGKTFDTDKLKAAIMQRPERILGQNAKMQHSETGTEAIFDIGLPALKGLAVNEKTGEFVVVDTCPGAGACQTYCYAMKGSYVMFKAVSMGLARMLNFLLNDPAGFASKLNAEIAAARSKYAKKGARIVVRWHDAGDFFSPEYLAIAYSVAEANPDVGFYAYTKMGDVANAARPKNFNMNFSQGAKTGQEKKVNITRTKHSKVVPKDMFFDLIARKGNELIKDAKGRMQFASPENLEKFKTTLAQKYAIDKNSILTYDQMMKTPVGAEPKWNVIVMPGDGDNSANRNDVIGSYLLFH